MDVQPQKISVIVITRNEEAIIRSCLESVRWADEIVLIDQSSTDRTREIAAEFTDKIFVTSCKGSCNPDRMDGIAKATQDWILFLDADEIVPPDLREEIQSVLRDPRGCTSFYLGRKNFFLGRWIRGCGWYPAYSIKLFRKGHAVFPSGVHRDARAVNGTAGYLKARTLHYTYTSLSQYLAKMDRFTTRSATEAFNGGFRILWFHFPACFILKPGFYFFRKYFMWCGFRDGFRGLFIAFSSGLSLIFHYAKIWELQNSADGSIKKKEGVR